MADYYDIKGQKVQNFATDPSPVAVGQLWYNTTSNTAKFQSVTTSAAWASGASTPVATTQSAGAGTYLAGIMFGGNVPAPTLLSNQSLTYDGSAWASTPTLNTGRGGIASANRGSQTSTLAFQGNTDNGPTYASNLSEEWNGSTWAAVNTLNIPSSLAGGTGIVTAALCVGGELAGPGYGNSNRTEEYDGTCWTAQTGRPATIRNHSLFGPQTAAVSCMGIDYTTTAQEWSGTGWTAGGVNNTARRGTNDGTGSGTAGLVAGGQAPGSNVGITATELYDGTSWTSSPASLSTGRFDCATFGTDTNAVSATGRTPTALTTVEEWSGVGAGTTKTLTTS